MRRGQPKTPGIALVTTVLLLPIMVILGFCVTRMCAQNLHLSQAAEHGKRAEYVAEAGASVGLQRLRDTTGTFGANWSGSFTHAMAVDTTMSANVTVTNNGTGSSIIYVSTPQGSVAVPGGMAHIYSSCRTPDKRTTRATGVLVKISSANSLFPAGAFGANGVTMSSNVFTDSYKSSEGLYDTVNTTNGILNRLSNGSVGSNAVLSLDSNEHINGNVKVGSTSGSTSGINGTLTTGVSPTTLQTVDCTYTTPNLNATGISIVPGSPAGEYTYNSTTKELKITKGAIALAPGSYYFSKISSSSNTEIRVSGETKIYVTGTVIFDSNTKLNNSTKIPKNFQIFSSSTASPAMKITSNIDFFGTIFAPKGGVLMDSNVAIFGAIAAKTLTLDSNTEVHFDQSLNESTPATVQSVNCWQRF